MRKQLYLTVEYLLCFRKMVQKMNNMQSLGAVAYESEDCVGIPMNFR